MSQIDISKMPKDIQHMITQIYYEGLAKDDENNYQDLISTNEDYIHIISDEEDTTFSAQNVPVPYYIDANNMDVKPLSNIDIMKDGFPYNGNLRKPWRHPDFGTNKTETLIKLHEEHDWTNTGGAMVNQKVKKSEKKKVVLGKERCIYKVSGSKKDYMKYKGKLVAVSDYIKYMKM
jgi:hypothetical protein